VAFVALCALGLQILILYAGGLQIRLNMAVNTAPVLVIHIACVLPDLQSGSVEYKDF